MDIRCPIIATVGHVDHGKTTLLDQIRGTGYSSKEPGAITQWISASFVPSDVIRNICGNLLKRLKIEMIIPGLLFIDTPGHEAFTTLRRRGGSVADLAVLVIDINEGFQQQTNESLEFLKQFKTPFIVAATKIDLIHGWFQQKNMCFLDSYQKQRDDVKEELEKKLYSIVAQLSERGFESERFDKITDFKKQVAIIPCSGKTGEGVSELLVMLAGLAQNFLKDRLELSLEARGSVLEVKDVKGLGTTIDVIFYDGTVKVGDTLIIGGKKPLVTKIKALLRPPALRELRVEKKFDSIKEVTAAAGIKISAPDLEDVIAGSPVICISDTSQIEEVKDKLQKEVEEVEFSRDVGGVIAKADTLGSLEALIKILKDRGIPIKKAEIGHVNKQDVVEVDAVKDDTKRAILGFNISILNEADELARDLKIKTFFSNIIYRLVEDYEKWIKEKTERDREEKLEQTIRPCKIRIIPGFVFRTRSPAIFGVEVLAGVLKVNTPMKKEDGKDIGKVGQLQKEGKNINYAKTGDKVAVSMEEPTVGRQIDEGDVLVSVITTRNIELLKAVWDRLQDDEKSLLKEWKLI